MSYTNPLKEQTIFFFTEVINDGETSINFNGADHKNSIADRLDTEQTTGPLLDILRINDPVKSEIVEPKMGWVVSSGIYPNQNNFSLRILVEENPSRIRKKAYRAIALVDGFMFETPFNMIMQITNLTARAIAGYPLCLSDIFVVGTALFGPIMQAANKLGPFPEESPLKLKPVYPGIVTEFRLFSEFDKFGNHYSDYMSLRTPPTKAERDIVYLRILRGKNFNGKG